MLERMWTVVEMSVRNRNKRTFLAAIFWV